MSELEGYRTGVERIHLAVNNQIGFTTNYPDARSQRLLQMLAKPQFQFSMEMPMMPR
ncbi:MAG: hypothetical protein IPH20_25125 [Bacteroidales bacterium]|nr:hypothetical protein [Bacteroidales bacterium]